MEDGQTQIERNLTTKMKRRWTGRYNKGRGAEKRVGNCELGAVGFEEMNMNVGEKGRIGN